MVIVITVPDTCSTVVVIQNVAVLGALVSRVMLKVALLPSDGTLLLRVFLLRGILLVI